LKKLAKALALSAMLLGLGEVAHAEKASHVDVLSCSPNTGGSALKVNVFAYDIDTGTGSPRYFSVYLTSSDFNALLSEEYFGRGYETCTFAGLSVQLGGVTVVDVSNAGVGVDVDAGVLTEDGISQRYTEVILSYKLLAIDGSKTPTVAPASEEEQAKALAAFKARGLALPRH
jgi:hypothetical protein